MPRMHFVPCGQSAAAGTAYHPDFDYSRLQASLQGCIAIRTLRGL